MKTIVDAGRTLKIRNPGKYDDLTDEEAGRLIKAAYPGKYDDYFDESAIEPYDEPSTTGSTFLQDLVNDFIPTKGFFSSWWSEKRTRQQNQFILALNDQQRNLLEHGRILEEAARTDKRNEITFRTFVAQNAKSLLDIRHKALLTENAMSEGLEVIHLQELKKTAGLSQIAVNEHRERTKIDLEARAAEYKIDQDNITRAQQEKLELLDRATARLFRMYEQRKELEISQDPARDDKISHLNNLISGAERLILAEQNRLLQITLGETTVGTLPAPNSDPSSSEESQTNHE